MKSRVIRPRRPDPREPLCLRVMQSITDPRDNGRNRSSVGSIYLFAAVYPSTLRIACSLCCCTVARQRGSETSFGRGSRNGRSDNFSSHFSLTQPSKLREPLPARVAQISTRRSPVQASRKLTSITCLNHTGCQRQFSK